MNNGQLYSERIGHRGQFADVIDSHRIQYNAGVTKLSQSASEF